MDSLKRRWKNTPASIRKPVVLVIGMALVIISPFTGVLPGPGGIPIFLIGVAILASEYEWAQRIRDPILKYIHQAGNWWRHNKVLGTILIIGLAACFFGLSYLIYSQF